MSDQIDSPAGESAMESERSEGGPLDATGAYETANGVVLYDTEDPLAWVQADNAVELAEMA